MADRVRYPVNDADVNALVDRLLAGVRTAIGDQFVGLYLHGSLAAGNFMPERSDIDFVVVTRADLADDALSRLQAMHDRMARGGLTWGANFEGSYIPVGAIRRYEGASVHPAVRVDGTFGRDEHRSEWVIQRHVIRERGIIVAGPAPDTLIDPVTGADLRQATSRLLQEWWRPQLADPFRLRSSEYQAYAILTMCRAQFTLATGEMASKPQAARWAKQQLEPRWAGLIVSALSWQHGVALDCFDGALAFIRYTVAADSR